MILAPSKCAAANPAIASRLQSNALVGRVAELGSLGLMPAAVVLLVLIAIPHRWFAVENMPNRPALRSGRLLMREVKGGT